MRTFKYVIDKVKKHLLLTVVIDGTTVTHNMDARYLPVENEIELEKKLAEVADSMVVDTPLVVSTKLQENTVKDVATVLAKGVAPIVEKEVIIK